MTETPQPPADDADELDRALWRAFYDWAVLRARWAAARAAAEADPDAPAAPAREDWDPVALLGVMGGCKNAGVGYLDVEPVLLRLARGKDDHRDFAELRELARKHRPAAKGHAPEPEVMEALRAGNFEKVREAYQTTSAIPKQAEAPATETNNNGGTE